MIKTAIIGLAFASLLATTQGEATTVLQYSFSDLVQQAETVVIGTVSAIEAEWDAARELPYTLVTLTTLDILKGESSQTALTLRFLGGPNPDGMILQLAGVPDFSIGDRNVLFVTGNNHYAVPLVGLWQGVYQVVYDPERETETLYTHTMQPLTTLPTASGGLLYDTDPLRTEEAQQTPAEALALETLTDMVEQEMNRD